MRMALLGFLVGAIGMLVFGWVGAVVSAIVGVVWLLVGFVVIATIDRRCLMLYWFSEQSETTKFVFWVTWPYHAITYHRRFV